MNRHAPDVRAPYRRLASAILSVVLTLASTTYPVIASEQDRDALQLAQRWQRADATVIRGPSGRVLFSYGRSQPRIVCAIFQLCDIGLQPGEVIESVNIGDSVRWDVSQARVGEGALLEEHLVIKPLEPDLRTTLFIGTNRRSYLIELLSHKEDSMGMVGFLYGGTASSTSSGAGRSATGSSDGNMARGNTGLAVLPAPPAPVVEPDPRAPSTPTGTSVAGDNLNFAYTISGARVPWRPIRVYDDGRRTYIDFDTERVSGAELPVFLVNDTDARGGMVNYRYDTRGRIVVDTLFTHGTLMLGKGRDAVKVRLTREPGRGGRQG